jgi:pyruvate kinase
VKRTKIIATIGPATSERETIVGLVAAGVNAFRINLSHGDPAQWASLIETIRTVTQDLPIIVDTQGPEVRLVNVPHPIHIKPGQEFVISTAPNSHIAHATHSLPLKPGQIILLDDGAITMLVEHVHGHTIHCRVQTEGTLTDRRKLTVPSDILDLPVLSESDITNILFCLERGADGVALSFTQRPEDVQTCRAVIGTAPFIIAKIENRAGVVHAERIIHEADAVMIARGDLGVEIPLEEVPTVQKRLALVANRLGKPVVVATQMLESMTTNPQPTRAEVSDVANAILDGADAIMLSGETARGRYPVQTVQTMARIAQATDQEVKPRFMRTEQGRVSTAEGISAAVYDLSESLHADAIVSATASGFTARMVSRFRPHIPIIAVAHDERAKRALQLCWGVTPIVFAKETSAHETIPDALRTAVAAGLLAPDNLVIATAGVNTRKHGSTNLIEVHRVRDLLTFHESQH